MTGLHHGYDRYDNRGHADFVHGGVPVEDFDEEPPRRSMKRKPMGGKRKRACRKSKTGEQCDFRVVITVHKWYDVVTCSRCGKHGEYKWKH